MLTPWHHEVERTCRACGTAWLVTGKQARFHPKTPFGRTQFKMSSYDLASQFTSDDQIAVLDKLRSCPKCALQNYTQRPVTAKHPASAGANSEGLD